MKWAILGFILVHTAASLCLVAENTSLKELIGERPKPWWQTYREYPSSIGKECFYYSARLNYCSQVHWCCVVVYGLMQPNELECQTEQDFCFSRYIIPQYCEHLAPYLFERVTPTPIRGWN